MARHEVTQGEIDEFTERVGATPVHYFEEVDPGWHGKFRDRNYFRFQDRLMIVKGSDDKGLWGVRREYIDHFNVNEDYLLVLLGRAGIGWVFMKAHVQAYVSSGKWNEGHDRDYKMNCSTFVPCFRFTSGKHFRKTLKLLQNGILPQ